MENKTEQKSVVMVQDECNTGVVHPQRHLPATLKMIFAVFIGGILAAGIIVSAQLYLAKPQKTIVAVDIKQVMEHKHKAIMEKYKGNYTDETAKLAEAEISEYVIKIKEGLEEISRNHVILSRDAILGDTVDVTTKLIAMADGEGKSKLPKEKAE